MTIKNGLCDEFFWIFMWFFDFLTQDNMSMCRNSRGVDLKKFKQPGFIAGFPGMELPRPETTAGNPGTLLQQSPVTAGSPGTVVRQSGTI